MIFYRHPIRVSSFTDPMHIPPTLFSSIFQRLIEHTDTDHPDYALLRRAEREIHELALKISSVEKETNEQEVG